MNIRPYYKTSFFFLGLSFIGLFASLGTWQLQRLSWKENLLETRKNALSLPPSPDVPDILENGHYKMVQLSGKIHPEFIKLYTQGKHRIVSPMTLKDGRVLFVILGTLNHQLPIGYDPTNVQHDTTLLTALLIPEPQKGKFTPNNDPNKNYWYHPTLTELEQNFKLKALPFIAMNFTQIHPTIAPIDAESMIELPNNHLMYAITWFSLAFMVLVLLFYYHFRGQKNDGIHGTREKL